jgi:hypothetical protein
MSATLSRVLAPCESCGPDAAAGILTGGPCAVGAPGGGGAAVDPRRVLTRVEHACRGPRGRTAHGGGVSAQTVSRLTRDVARPMVCVVNVQSVERIILSIINRFNLGWRLRILRQCTHVA